MKMILAAVALAIASPAVAQISAPADPHANHAGHQQGGTDHAGRDMQSECCCEKMKAEGKKMECCDKSEGSAAEADPHAGHNMNGQ